MGGDPIRQGLRPRGLRVCVVAGAHGCHKNLSLPDLSGPFVNNRYCMPRIVNKQLLSGLMIKSHGNINLTGPFFVISAEPAVLITIRMCFLIFLP